jgi:hypothetical protein
MSEVSASLKTKNKRYGKHTDCERGSPLTQIEVSERSSVCERAHVLVQKEAQEEKRKTGKEMECARVFEHVAKRKKKKRTK